jgi:hypothetical protein
MYTPQLNIQQEKVISILPIVFLSLFISIFSGLIFKCNAQEVFLASTKSELESANLIQNKFSGLLYAKKDTTSNRKNKYKPKLSGFIQVHLFNEFDTNGDSVTDPSGFRILRARLTVDGFVSNHIGYEVTVDPRAPEVKGILRDAWIGLHYIPNQEIRIGQQKTNFGYENPISSTKLYVVNRAEMSDNISRGTNLRDVGIGLLGNIPLNNGWLFEDDLNLVNGSGLNPASPNDFMQKKSFWGRVGVRHTSDKLVWRMGASAGVGDMKDFGNDVVNPADDFIIGFKRFGADMEADHKFFFAVAEFATSKNTISDTVSNEIGYYGLIALKTKWRIGPLLRYDVYGDEIKRWTAGAYYGLPKDDLRVLLNWEYRGYKSEANPAGNDNRLYIQLQVVF